MSQLRVFVSHSSSDKAFADALVRALRQAGADVWYDEHNLGAGQLLTDIQRELGTRLAFVVVLSKAALASEWVGYECQWAWNLYRREPQRIILPVVATPITSTDFNAMLFLEDFKRVEGPSGQPYPQAEAIERTLRLLALTPVGQAGTSVDDLIARGKALSAQGQHAQAIPFFEVATHFAPDNLSAWFNLGYAHNLLKHWPDGLAAYERALAIRPNDAVAWNNKGNTLRGLTHFEEALAAYDRALALDPNYANAWNGKGSALRSLGHYEEALVAYDRALDLSPTDAHTWNGKGNTFSVLGRDGELGELLDFDTNLAIKFRGTDALRSQGRYEEALAAYDRALTLNPNFAAAWRNKGNALNDLKRYEEALAACENALALEPQSAHGWRGKAVALKGLGREAEAQDARARAKELGE